MTFFSRQAAINVAEGHKQSILESEAVRARQVNHALGNFSFLIWSR